ncbi:MAG: hypothetical protein LBV32_08160, partial [Tannerellaceae bacterium]|nr:hypothetical protein [Tannerellaceae bacterium]
GRIKDNSVYNDIAVEVVKDLATKVHKELPVGFASGISGVGWGIEFLIQNGFIEGNSLEVCEELDHFIMKNDIRRMKDCSLETGLGGILAYVLSHISGVCKQNGIYPFDEMFMNDLYVISQDEKRRSVCEKTKQQMDRYIRFYRTREVVNTPMLFTEIIHNEELIKEDNLSVYPVGLKNGLAGKVLNQYRYQLVAYERDLYLQ